MNFLRNKLSGSSTLARVLPFAIFLLLTFAQGQFGEASRYWFYVAKTFVGAWLIWEMRSLVSEMRWAFSWEAVAAGVLVCGLWIGLDGLYPKIGAAGPAWNPHAQFGEGSALAWVLVAVRLFGSSVVVPPLEEVFYRSFFYRSLARADFQKVPLGYFAWLPFLATSVVFGLMHPQQWLAGILCGLIYQGLVIRKQRLGDAMTAHAITNFLLGLWVLWKGAWQFW